MVLINPEIVAASGEMTCQEGCLSLPDYFANVKRYEKVTVRALDRNEQPIEIHGSGLLAVVLQHEIDHLDGKLFIDYLGPISRDLFRRKWKKRQKEAANV
jgi:peptide deformylase